MCNRREFMRRSIAGSLAVVASSSPFRRLGLAADVPAPVDVRSLLEGGDPEVMKLLEDIFRECVLGKLRPPEGTLKRTWITAGGGFYGQWIWDTMFVVDLLSLLPGMERNIRDIFRNYWDFQARWNEQMPAYAHDMVSCMIEPKNDELAQVPGLLADPHSRLGHGARVPTQRRQGTPHGRASGRLSGSMSGTGANGM